MLFMILSSSILLQLVSGASKYNADGEDNPYEFGFTIDGQQHRHEKKDANGIIQGEFGFITADGIYHVTVYATDENGNFKILSMRNVRVSGPLDQPDSKLPDTSQFSKGGPKPSPNPLAINTSPAPVQMVTSHGGFTTQPTIKPACAGCGYVTQKPTAGNKLPFQTSAGVNPKPGTVIFGAQPPGVSKTTEAPFTSRPLGDNGPHGNIPFDPSSPGNPPFNPSSPGNPPFNPSSPGSPPFNPSSPGNPPFNPSSPGSPPFNPSSPGNPPFNPSSPGNPPFNPSSPGNPPFNPSSPGNPPQHETPRFPDSQDQPTNHPQPPFNPLSIPSPISTFTDRPPGGIMVDHSMILVPGNSPIPIQDKFPGMVDGLPPGITKDDVTELLYKFNYTVGFHGHYEKGYKSGAKVGGYFVNDRDGVSRIVTYVADENGYRPKVKFIRLDLNSDLVPKEGTEKTFGLKNFEFVWYPIK